MNKSVKRHFFKFKIFANKIAYSFDGKIFSFY